MEMAVEVELRSVPEGKETYEAVARLVVNDDGSHEVWDPGSVVPALMDLPVLVPLENGERGVSRIAFRDDPAEWARRLDTVLRTGYLVPVVVRDDQVDHEGTSHGG